MIDAFAQIIHSDHKQIISEEEREWMNALTFHDQPDHSPLRRVGVDDARVVARITLVDTFDPEVPDVLGVWNPADIKPLVGGHWFLVVGQGVGVETPQYLEEGKED